MKKNIEDLVELSKETLKKYIPVAVRQGFRARNSETIGKETGHGSDWDTKAYGKMADKREKGVKAAMRKVYRKNQLGEDVLEEVEQIDELTKELKNRYADKIIQTLGDRARAKGIPKGVKSLRKVLRIKGPSDDEINASIRKATVDEEVEYSKGYAPPSKATPERTAAKKAYDRAHADYVKNRNADTHAKMLAARTKMTTAMMTKAMGEEVEQIDELSNKIYKSYSKKSSRDADKHINRFLKGGNEKSLTHAEKRSKGINTAQQLMAKKKMTVEETKKDEDDTVGYCVTCDQSSIKPEKHKGHRIVQMKTGYKKSAPHLKKE
jgi:hypothetical protein